MYIFYPKQIAGPPGYATKILLIMRLTTLILITAILQVSANSFAQKISLSEKNASLNKVFDQIRTQTGYDFFFTTSILQQAKPVTIKVKNEEMEVVLKKIFEDQDLEYAINKKSVTISRKTPSFLDKVVDAFTPPIDVRGTVLDEKGQPLAGVTVRVKGTNKATSTDNAGKFYLAGVDDDAVIEFRMVGYKVLEVKANGKFDGIRMEVLSKELEEVVVAYGKTTLQALTGSVTVVKGEQIESLPNRSFDKSLQGLVPGLVITNGTGQPGGGVSNMVLRGISTGTEGLGGSTVRNPLIVIDGIPVSQDHFQKDYSGSPTPVTNPMAQINPYDIETISVLKDAAAVALYGSKASNGVILVTTKRGAQGKNSFSFNHQTDLSFNSDRGDRMVNQEEYLELLYETFRNTNPVLYKDQDIRKMLFERFPYKVSGTDTSFYQAPDWKKELFERAATTFSNNISMSSGMEKSLLYGNIEYTKQKGIVKETGFERTSIRLNLDNKTASWFKFSISPYLSYSRQKFANPTEAYYDFGLGSIVSPLNPVRRDDGSYVLTYLWGGLVPAAEKLLNPVAAAEYNINKNDQYRGLLTASGEISFLKHFTFTSTLGADFMLTAYKTKQDPRFDITNYENSNITDKDIRRTGIISNNILRYQTNIGTHHGLELLIGQEAQIKAEKVMNLAVKGKKSTLPYYDDISSPGYTLDTYQSYLFRNTLLSQFTSLNYNYQSKYYLSGSFRRDGSSLFGDNNKFGNYWSGGAGWVISSEKFMSGTKEWLSFLKLRSSLGISGNSSAITNRIKYDMLTQIQFFTENAFLPGAQPGNASIQWEQTYNWDFGLQLGLFEDKVNITADIYNKKTNNLIYRTNLPSITGYAQVMDNVGDISNRGVELSIQASPINKNGFKWNVNANWSMNKNLLVRSNTPLVPFIISPYLANEEGREFNSIYLPIWAGVNPSNGNAQYLDANGNPTEIYRDAKKEFVGKVQPTGFGSVTNILDWKSWQLNFQFYYQYGNMIYNTSQFYVNSDGAYVYANQTKAALDRWQKPGDQAKNPIRKLTTSNNHSTRYLGKGDHIKLQNVTLRYSLPATLLSKMRISMLKLFIQGNNLAIWTTGNSDPDMMTVSGETAFGYPSAKNFTAGLTANF